MKIKRKDQKGKNGKVLVVGGSKRYTGAPYFASIAAYRTGVDIVTLCAPEKVAWTINLMSPDIITTKMLGEELDMTHTKEILALSESHDVLLIGNGFKDVKLYLKVMNQSYQVIRFTIHFNHSLINQAGQLTINLVLMGLVHLR